MLIYIKRPKKGKLEFIGRIREHQKRTKKRDPQDKSNLG
jgi:hypothetical protein